MDSLPFLPKYKKINQINPINQIKIKLLFIEAVSRVLPKIGYYLKLWCLNLDLKSVSEDARLRSIGELFHN